MNDGTRVKNYRIIYKVEENHKIESERFQKFINLLVNSNRVKMIYTIFLEETSQYSVYLEYTYAKSFKSLRCDIKSCGLLIENARFGKLIGSKNKLLNAFIHRGLVYNEIPFVYYNEKMLDENSALLLKLRD